MIYNENIDRLTEIDIVKDFVANHKMTSVLCKSVDEYSLLLFRHPFFIEIHDALSENYLEITLSELTSGLLITGSSALGCSLDLGLQDLSALRTRVFDNHPLNHLFLSFGSQKMRNLHSFLEALDKLLPYIEIEGNGLQSMREGRFDRRFDFSQSVDPMYPGLKEKYFQHTRQNI
jgi:hypothetical protein